MKTKWMCTKCKTVALFDKDVSEESFQCSHCSHRFFVPVKEKTAGKQKLFRLCWKHRDFETSSEGPVLVHFHTKRLFTKAEADKRCEKRNLSVKDNLVRHWIEEVNGR